MVAAHVAQAGKDTRVWEPASCTGAVWGNMTEDKLHQQKLPSGKAGAFLSRKVMPHAGISRLTPYRKFQLRLQHYLEDARDRAGAAFLLETETGSGFNVLPVFVALGIAVYFLAPAEPNPWALLVSLMLSVWLCLRMNGHGISYFMMAGLAAVFAGMVAGKLAVMRSQAPVIERQITAEINAIVIETDQNKRGSARYVVQPASLGSIKPHNMPARLRISASARHERFLPGDTIRGIVRLQPVSGPVISGSYDFGFFAWFERLGGSGFFMGAPQHGNDEFKPDIAARFAIAVNKFRISVENRIHAALPGTNGAVAVALVTGNKSGIPEDIQNALRRSGLAHILAISGLHMALVTLTVVWLVRLILVRIHSVAFHYPVKKLAVTAGFFSSTFYLFMSGAGVATQRAWIMITVMLLAVLMDRRAITMRSVAISALIILVISPQSLFAPGFQMSFAAVASLVAGYELINRKRMERREHGLQPAFHHWSWRLWKNLGTYLAGITITSLIAGTATGFVAAWHFNLVAPLGLVANLLAMPVVSLIVMPFVLASVLLMPYGLEAIALIPVGYGIETVVDIARLVEQHSPNGTTGLLPTASIGVFGLFLACLTIPRTRLRYCSFAILPLFFLLPQRSIPPDIVIAENGRAAAVRNETGELVLFNTRLGGFVTGIWAKAWADGSIKRLSLGKDQCNRDRCIHVLPNSRVLHLVYDPDLLQSSCRRADILVAPRLWWVNCRDRVPELVLKRIDFERHGTHEIRFVSGSQPFEGKGAYRISTGLPKSTRPWNRIVRPVETVSDIGG